MTDEALRLVEGEMKRLLETMQTLEPSSSDYKTALLECQKLSNMINEDKKVCAEVTKTCSELEKADTLASLESRKLEAQNLRDIHEWDFEEKRLELEKQRIAVEEQKNKVDSNRTKADIARTVVDGLAKGLTIVGTLIAVDKVTSADLSGDYISKPAMSFLPKFHL